MQTKSYKQTVNLVTTDEQWRRRAEGTEEDISVAEGHDLSLWLNVTMSSGGFLLLAEGHDKQWEQKKTEVFRFRF